MDEILRALQEAQAALESVETQVGDLVNEDSHELREAYAGAISNLGRARTAATALGAVAAEAAPPPEKSEQQRLIDDGVI